MPQSRTPLFLARRSYRRRRLVDAARLLPFLGLFLFLLPVFWYSGPRYGIPAFGNQSGGGVIYLFTTWGFLVAAAAVLARKLGPSLDEDGGDPPPPPLPVQAPVIPPSAQQAPAPSRRLDPR